MFNQPMYVRVRDKNIRTITIKISTETGEEFPIQDDVVTCRPQPLPPTIFGLDLYKE